MKSILFWLLTVLSAGAGLEWQQTEVLLDPHPVQTHAVSSFTFQNTGTQPVTIVAMAPNCGCLFPRISKRICSPGESGELSVRFDLRNRTGKQRKAVTIKTDDGKTFNLYTAVDIPQAYAMSPAIMTWPPGSEDGPKTAKLTNPNAVPITIKSITSSNKDLPAELKTIREGFEYEVVVTRLTETANTRSVIRIQTEPPQGMNDAKMLKLYVHAQ
jgi:hypothetical protein